jgi:uncharacterized BrkB/YihY/UPF0761 family membrane protein
MEQLRRLPPAVDDFQQRAALLAYHGFLSLFPLLLGAVLAALAWALLQWLGGWYVARQLSRASALRHLRPGHRHAVVAYLASTVTPLAAELNVVRTRRLWPRSLAPPPLGRPDERALEGLTRQEERLLDQRVEVSFGDTDDGAGRLDQSS